MNLFQIVILVSVAGNSALGLFILLANPKRTVNISFFVLTFIMMLWLGSMLMTTLDYHSPESILFWVRQTSAIAGLLPLGVFLLNSTIAEPHITLWQALFKLRFWIVICLSMVAICHSPFFVLSTEAASETQTVPVSEYGIGFIPYVIFFTAVSASMIGAVWKSSRTLSGVQRAESQFLQLGCWMSFSSGFLLYTASVVFDFQEISRFVPLSVLIVDGSVAYGIATRRILSASEVVQRILAYTLISAYLILLYIASVRVGSYLLMFLVEDATYFSHLLAAMVVAFSLAPAHGWMQSFARGLFPYAAPVDVDQVLTEAGHIFQEVSTETNLAEQFFSLVTKTFSTESLTLLRPDEKNESFVQVHPGPSRETKPLQIHAADPLVALLKQERKPITVELLERMRRSRRSITLQNRLSTLGAAVVIGGFTRNEMETVLLLSPKKTRRIYDLHEQKALQLLCDQFAVALENAGLYTAIQNGKIYNDILLDSLTSGIVAVDANRTVTVFNQQAQALTGLAEADVLRRPMSVLPLVLAVELETVLQNKTAFRDRDISIEQEERTIPLRVSGSLFRSESDRLLGALLVINDMSKLKQMEEQIRRTDRLSSIGTLTAGMAHEIKNPLVTIKTFAQLLPEQYQDDEFRLSFFNLVDHEVKRIDEIVNRLLHFSRPEKASLRAVSLHTIVNEALQLIDPQLKQYEITLDRRMTATQDTIHADAGQIKQALINFFLNATDAMRGGGTLTVSTAMENRFENTPAGEPVRKRRFLKLEIKDTGCGIAPENLTKIFDPFYTTKEHGVGLGLSVSHGIIQENRALLEVESRLGSGTIFRVLFPV